MLFPSMEDCEFIWYISLQIFQSDSALFIWDQLSEFDQLYVCYCLALLISLDLFSLAMNISLKTSFLDSYFWPFHMSRNLKWFDLNSIKQNEKLYPLLKCCYSDFISLWPGIQYILWFWKNFKIFFSFYDVCLPMLSQKIRTRRITSFNFILQWFQYCFIF